MCYCFKESYPVKENNVFIAPGARVIGNVKIGSNSSIWHNAVVRGDVAPITIGNKTNIQDNCTLHADAQTELTIGDLVTLGHNAVLHGCYIGSRVLIGMGAIVLNGATIGEDSLIAAGSVILPGQDIPTGSLVMGTPGKVKRQLSHIEKEKIKEAAQSYVNLSQEYLNGTQNNKAGQKPGS